MLGERVLTEDEIAQVITSDRVEKSLLTLFTNEELEPASNYNTVAPDTATFMGNNRNPESPRSIIRAIK